ncbi:MAG: tetratricopeptide repeat protein [Stygiobacter sp.]
MTYEEKKTRANELRKAQHYSDALILYRELYNKVDDKFNLSGLLHCLRKTDNLEEAVRLADEVKNKYIDFEWFKNEIIWTLIQGKLFKIPEDGDVNTTIEEANRILELNPDQFAKATIIFRVLKVAKKNSDWKTISEWSSKLDVDTLNDEPLLDDKGHEGWSKKSIWYNYRIKALIEDERYDEAEILTEQAITLYPKFKKFFLRLKGIIKVKQGNLEEAKLCYEEIIKVRNVDWWLLHEYGRVLTNIGDRGNALQNFYLAASKSFKLENSVKLFYDISALCIELERYPEAAAHLYLTKFLRESKGWGIPDEINSSFQTLADKKINISYPDLKSALNECKKFWSSESDNNNDKVSSNNIIGILSIVSTEQPFAFIKTKEYGKVFCLKKDLPKSANDGDKVEFKMVKSFDKKKNIESWKAINIKKVH